MNGKGRVAYELSEEGSVVVVDRRHLTNGAIVPNYVVDLYLPIIGYAGLGVLTLLYRFVNRASHEIILDLHKHALAGGVGFPKLARLLDLLRECQIITIEKPSGLARRLHHRTRIELLDAPTEAPAQFTELILRRTPATWLLNQEVLGSTSIKVPGSTSMEVPGSTSMEVPGSTSMEVPDSTSMEVPGSTSIKVPDSTSMLDVPTGDVPTEDASSSDPRRDADDDPTVAYLRELHIDAAAEFAGLDLAAVQERVRQIQRDPNWRPGAIVKSLRSNPPAPAAESQRAPLISSADAARRAQAIAPADATAEEVALLAGELESGSTDDQALDWLAGHRAFHARWSSADATTGARP